MGIYNHKKYRKIYEHYYGTIPVDEHGRTYEIHHIDGNRKNNNIENLVALSIQDHYDIHHHQEEWAACRIIAIRIGKSSEEISQLSVATNKKRVDNGTHNFLNGEHTSKRNKEMLENGTHHFLSDDHPMKIASRNGSHHFFGGEIQSADNRKRVANGSHQFLGGKIQRETIAAGKNPLVCGDGRIQRELLESGNHPSQVSWTCEFCGTSGKGKGNFTRFHGANCKRK